MTSDLFGQTSKRKPVKVIPSISIYNISGDTANLKSLSQGKVTFIDFWFIPCGPCFAEMNLLHKLHAKYKNNPNVSFLTITLTDSSFLRPLIENRNTSNNETYNYFKTFAGLDSFELPVYFIKNVVSKQISLVKSKAGFAGKGEPGIHDESLYPDYVLGFPGYPTIFIFDKQGKTIYNKTGFTKDSERQLQQRIETLINANL